MIRTTQRVRRHSPLLLTSRSTSVLVLFLMELGAAPSQAAIFSRIGAAEFAPGVALVADTQQGGLVAQDLNNDGLPDLVILRDATEGPLVLGNLGVSGTGTLRFQEELFALPGAGSGSSPVFPTGLMVAADFDQDGDIDLLATDDGSGTGLWLWENDLIDNGWGTPTLPGAFDFHLGTRELGLDLAPTRVSGAVVLDFEGDGDLDAVIDTPTGTKKLFLNQLSAGDYRFLAASSGSLSDSVSGGQDLATFDLNLDGFPELMSRACPSLNSNYDVLFVNSSSRLQDMNGSRTAFGSPATYVGNNAGVGSAWADYDNDGDLDAVIQNPAAYVSTTFYATRFFLGAWNPSSGIEYTFSDVNSGELGVTLPSLQYQEDFGGSAVFGDVNNDGRLDLYLGSSSTTDGDRLYLNQGASVAGRPWQLADQSSREAELETSSRGDTEGVAMADFDLDGDLDLYLHKDSSEDIYLRNGTSSSTGFGALRARVTCWGRDCIGATAQLFKASDSDGDGIPDVYRPGISQGTVVNGTDYGRLSNAIVAGTLMGTRQVSGGVGIGAQAPFLLHFGIPDPKAFYTLRVVFPSGKVILKDVQPSTASGSFFSRALTQFVAVDIDALTEDGDGLPLTLETSLGSNPYDLDSDDDGLMDSTELWSLTLNPASQDTDGDGLSDGLESGLSTGIPDPDDSGPIQATDPARFKASAGDVLTDPTRSDTDGDGLSDGEEDRNYNGRYDASLTGSAQETPALDMDADDDGINDGAEVKGYTWTYGGVSRIYFSSPRSADSDGDGLADGLEVGLQAPMSQGTLPSGILGTDLSTGAFVSDGYDQGSASTDPFNADSDGDGLPDGLEDANHNGRWDVQLGETDPAQRSSDAGCDDDGVELHKGTNPLDAQDDSCSDPDSDGCDNATEASAGTNPRSADTDKDGLGDCMELSTGTSPLKTDSDGDLISDGTEDANRNGKLDSGETDPRRTDSDGDGIGDGIEDANRNGKRESTETSTIDADSDDDGMADGVEDPNRNGVWESGETSPLKADTDGDGLPDGLERAWLVPDGGTDLSAKVYVTDQDPASTTDPLGADSDGDGLTDGQEDLSGNGRVDAGETDPNRTDSDGDTLTDGYELLTLKTDPTRADSDGDGLNDDLEVRLATDPLKADTDGDGLTDYEEVEVYGTSAVKADSDGDGLSDSDELKLYGTNPRSTDTDGDSLSDKSELFHQTEPSDPLSRDSDGDGVDDAVEVAALCGLEVRNPDTDGDGLSDGEEDRSNRDCIFDPEVLETNPLDDDTDDDGLSDGLERRSLGTDPLKMDSDGDGLPDGLELGLSQPGAHDTRLDLFVPDLDPETHSLPLVADSDGDGLSDGTEDLNGNGRLDAGETDPLLTDTDSDGLSDGDELKRYKTDPTRADTDGGCESDGLEVAAGRDPVANPLDDDCADADGDGLSNSLEVSLFRSNPDDADTDDDGVLDGLEPGLVDSDDDGLMDAWAPELQGVPRAGELSSDGLQPGEAINAIAWELEPGDFDSDGLNSILDPDSDNDGILDATELGIVEINQMRNPDGGLPTDVSGRAFIPDADPQTTTDAHAADSDGAGADDGAEDPNHNGRVDAGELDPGWAADDPPPSASVDGICALGTAVQDSDCDGLTDNEEQNVNSGKVLWVDSFDPDSDDDGVLDGLEANWSLDSDGDGLINVRDADSDNDGLLDGTELGISAPGTGTDLGAGSFRADLDPSSTSSMIHRDTDFGGSDDGAEDPNHDGRRDQDSATGVELDPRSPGDDQPIQSGSANCNSSTVVADADCDGLTDLEELYAGTNALDADCDDDGIPDGREDNWSLDGDADGRINALDCDSDLDGLFDGTERGITLPWGSSTTGTDVTRGCFKADDDPSSKTIMLNPDTDGGLALDGDEDANHNGRIDGSGSDRESDPLLPGDDCTDNDLDGLCDADEQSAGTDPYDSDTDDDGVLDSQEGSRHSPWYADFDGDGLCNALDPDSDNDGILDGTERGIVVTALGPDTRIDRGYFLADADPGTTSDPCNGDEDGDSLRDGIRDANHNGSLADDSPLSSGSTCQGSTLLYLDSDCDGLSDDEERTLKLNPNDADCDDDGVLDGDEENFSVDLDADGLSSALDWDSDGDGLADGTERGLTSSMIREDLGAGMGGTRLEAQHFFADADPSTRTFASVPDSDQDGFEDGEEDCNQNGSVDCVESDPLDGSDPRAGTLLSICADTDGDGLSDSVESRLGTNPYQEDSDADGVADLVETDGVVCSGSARDSDGDGLIDALDPDSDNDGLSDYEETGHGRGELIDTDGNGIPDYLQFNEPPPSTPTPAPCDDFADSRCNVSCGCSQNGPPPPWAGSSLLLLLGLIVPGVRRLVGERRCRGTGSSQPANVAPGCDA